MFDDFVQGRPRASIDEYTLHQGLGMERQQPHVWVSNEPHADIFVDFYR